MLALTGFAAAVNAEGQRCLNDFEAGVARDYSAITHVTAEQFETLMADPAKVLLLDARPAIEVGVSRIPGAIDVDPDIGADAFMVRFGDLVRGRDVIIYCSVGVRSSRLATRVRATLQQHGAKRVANLRGGIFAWHNTGRWLVDKAGQTEWVHPYSRRWSYYIDFKNLTRMEPN